MKRRRPTPPPRSARMFPEPEPRHPSETFIAHIDGASRGNPGPSAYAVLIHKPDGTLVCQLKKYLGEATNNVAEYAALLSALEYAINYGIHRLRVRSDSELLVRQMLGHYRVRSAILAPMHEMARKQAAALDYFAIEHIPREANREADKLANAILDQTTGKTSAASPPAGERKGKSDEQAIRARCEGGLLRPLKPLELAEGEEVEITVRRRRGR